MRQANDDIVEIVEVRSSTCINCERLVPDFSQLIVNINLLFMFKVFEGLKHHILDSPACTEYPFSIQLSVAHIQHHHIAWGEKRW